MHVDSCIFITRRILNPSLQTGKQQHQPRKTVTISLKHLPRRAYHWLQWHLQWRSVEYATARQNRTSLWFLLVCVLALCSMYIRAVCRDGLRVQTLRNVNCVNMSSAWNPRWSLSQRLVMVCTLLNNLKVHKLHKHCSTVHLKLHHNRVSCACTTCTCIVFLYYCDQNLMELVDHGSSVITGLYLQLMGIIIGKLICVWVSHKKDLEFGRIQAIETPGARERARVKDKQMNTFMKYHTFELWVKDLICKRSYVHVHKF